MAGILRTAGGTRKAFLFGGIVVTLALVWAVGRWASAPVYVTLYRDLDFKDAAEINESLQSSSIPNRLGAGGTEVLVPASEVARARVALAKDGHAMGGRPGLELFDKPGWGMTDFAQRVTYQRALEGELARTIGAIRGVQRVQVHLALPAPSPLRRLEQNASASVLLTLEQNMVLSPETIQGITFMVASSVEQLSAENVAVMDDGGRLLSMPDGPGSESGAATRQVEMQRGMEELLLGKIQDLLEPVLGAGRVHAEVSVQLSFDKVDRTEESFAPMSTDAEAGADAGFVPAEGGAARSLERREGAVGTITRLTAAVLVDEKALASGDGSGTGTSTLTLDQVQGMVRDAIGIDDARGDRVTVAAVPFAPVPVPTPSGGETSGKPGFDILRLVDRLIRPLLGLGALVVLVLLGLRTIRLIPASLAASSGPGNSDAVRGTGGGGEPGPRMARIADTAAATEAKPEVSLEVVRGWLRQG
jgi:flagellar M-ring protein FliF